MEGGASAASGPALRIATLEELKTELEARRGRAYLLNFWATWCEPCVEELPDLADLHTKFVDQGGGVVGISYDLMVPGPGPAKVLQNVERLARGRELPFDNYVFDDDDYSRINAWLELPGPVPVTLAIDARGEVVDRQEGKAGPERFEAMMRTALGSE